jgi:secreted trypsin-like serine protease
MNILASAFLLVSAFFTTANGDCGNPTVKSDIARIVGGKTAEPYSWPWQVALYQYRWFAGFILQCGGSIISDQWIMTAAHCVSMDPYASKYKIKLGVHNTRNDLEHGMIVSTVEAVYIHPNYDAGSVTYDVALLKLSKPIQFTDHIQPICLPYQDEPLPEAGSKVVVTGWGLLRTGGTYPDTLQEVAVEMVDNSVCKSAYPQLIYEEVMFCAGSIAGGKDSCNGDSGGPLVYYDQTSNHWEQLGIVSWGDQICAKTGKPGVYSKVSAYIDWIEKYTTVQKH